jgi:hypothetical protein
MKYNFQRLLEKEERIILILLSQQEAIATNKSMTTVSKEERFLKGELL